MTTNTTRKIGRALQILEKAGRNNDFSNAMNDLYTDLEPYIKTMWCFRSIDEIRPLEDT